MMSRSVLFFGMLLGLFALALIVPPDARAQLAAGLSAGDVTTARAAPITRGGKEVVTSTASTTPKALFSTDVGSTLKVSTVYTQNIRVANRHASQTACIFDLAWAGVSTCQTLCAAASGTCSGASTDGAPIPAGGSYTESWDGTACLCIVASGASTTFTAERVMRSPN
jgi:hypothetical protein